MNKIKKLGWILLVLLQACSGKNESQNQITQESVVQSKELSILFDATKQADQNAAEVFDLGTVSSSGSIKKILTITNSTTTNLALSFADLQTKIAATTRFGLNMATATPCGTTLKINKSCSIELTLNNVANESYDAITTNILSGQTNPNFGVMMFSGVKSNDTTSSVPLSGTIRLNKIADSFSVPANASLTKRFYIGNIGTKSIKTPTIVAPANGVISSNSCSSLSSLKINGTCFFEITYNSDLSPAKASLNDQVKFTSNDASIDTTGLAIDLAITNQPAIVPVISANFNQLGSFKSTSDAISTVRLYVNNTGSATLNASTIAIPSPYIVSSTSCTSALKVGKSCYMDIKLDTTKTANMTTQITSISVGSSSVLIKAGAGSATTCASGYNLTNGVCTAVVVSGTDSLYFTLEGVGHKIAADGTLTSGLLPYDTQANGANNLRSGYGTNINGLVAAQDYSGQMQIFDSILQTSKLVAIPSWTDSQGMMQTPFQLRWFHNLGNKIYFTAAFSDSISSVMTTYLGTVDGNVSFMTDTSTISDLAAPYGGLQDGFYITIGNTGSLYTMGDTFVWLNSQWVKKISPQFSLRMLFSYDMISGNVTQVLPDAFYQMRDIVDISGKLYFVYNPDGVSGWTVLSLDPATGTLGTVLTNTFNNTGSYFQLYAINNKLYMVDLNSQFGVIVYDPTIPVDGSLNNPHTIAGTVPTYSLTDISRNSKIPAVIGNNFYVAEWRPDIDLGPSGTGITRLLKIDTITDTATNAVGSDSFVNNINNAFACDGQMFFTGVNPDVLDQNGSYQSMVWVYNESNASLSIIDQLNYENYMACVNNKVYYVGESDSLLHEYTKGSGSSVLTNLPGYSSSLFLDRGLITQKPQSNSIPSSVSNLLR